MVGSEPEDGAQARRRRRRGVAEVCPDPEQLSRPEGTGAFVVWFTGLPGAGKTTIAEALTAELERRGHLVDRLDGDVVRENLSPELGFSKADRDENVGRIAWVAARIARAGAIVAVSAIAPYDDARRAARELISLEVPFFEVHVATPVEECVRRDPKGLYARALGGELERFTGISDPYELPAEPELRLDTRGFTPAESAAAVLERLEEVGLLQPERATQHQPA